MYTCTDIISMCDALSHSEMFELMALFSVIKGRTIELCKLLVRLVCGTV